MCKKTPNMLNQSHNCSQREMSIWKLCRHKRIDGINFSLQNDNKPCFYININAEDHKSGWKLLTTRFGWSKFHSKNSSSRWDLFLNVN